jgi:hypothetical protein
MCLDLNSSAETRAYLNLSCFMSVFLCFCVVRICHRSLRRLPWTDAAEGIEDFIVKVVMRMVRKKYTSITNIADCLSGLHR